MVSGKQLVKGGGGGDRGKDRTIGGASSGLHNSRFGLGREVAVAFIVFHHIWMDG